MYKLVRTRNCLPSLAYTVCKIFAPIFPIWITCYPPIRMIIFLKYLRIFEIKRIKTVEFRFIQIGKRGAKILHTVYISTDFTLIQKQPYSKFVPLSVIHVYFVVRGQSPSK